MSNEVHVIEQSIEAARADIERNDAVNRLYDNHDFKSVILEGYFKEEAARIVALKADPAFVFADDKQMEFLNILEAGVGALQQYFRLIEQKADMAERGLGEMEETRTEILREDAL
jgi:hypothetical protein